MVLRYGAIEMYSSLTATVTMLALLLLRLRGDEMKFVPWKGVALACFAVACDEATRSFGTRKDRVVGARVGEDG